MVQGETWVLHGFFSTFRLACSNVRQENEEIWRCSLLSSICQDYVLNGKCSDWCLVECVGCYQCCVVCCDWLPPWHCVCVGCLLCVSCLLVEACQLSVGSECWEMVGLNAICCQWNVLPMSWRIVSCLWISIASPIRRVYQCFSGAIIISALCQSLTGIWHMAYGTLHQAPIGTLPIQHIILAYTT